MMTKTTPKPIGLSSIILAQRCAGSYRASICKTNGTNELQVSLEKINDQTLAYEPCCSLTGEEWCQAVDAMVQLTNAIPEAKRSLSVEHLIYCSEHRRTS